MSAALYIRRQNFAPPLIVTLVGLGIAVSLLGDTTLYIVLPTHTAQAGILLTDVGLMLSANRLIRIFLNSPYGVLIERLPRRRVMIPSLLIGALSSLLYAFPGFWPLLIGRLLWGITWAGIWIGASTVVLDIATPGNRGRMVGRLQMWSYLGLGVTAIVGGLLTDSFDYTTPFIISAVLNLLAAIAWWLFLPETHPDTRRTTSNAPEVADTPAPRLTTASKPIPVVSRGTLLIAVILLGLNWLFFLGALGAVLSLLVEERIGTTVLLAGLVIQLSTFTGGVAVAKEVVSLVASPIAGWLSDRQGRRWWLIVVAVELGIISLALVAVSEGVVLLLAILLTAVVSGILQTQSMTLAGDYARTNKHGRIIGLLNTVGDVGSAGGPLLAFKLLEVVGLSEVFALAALLLTAFLPIVIYRAWREGR